jgi:hypothetical protein
MQPEMKIVTMASQCSRDLERIIRRHGILFYMTKPVAPSLVRELVLHLMKPKGSPVSVGSRSHCKENGAAHDADS